MRRLSLRRQVALVSAGALAATGITASAFSSSASAFNPQPDPPGRVILSIGGPNQCTIDLLLLGSSLPVLQLIVRAPIAGLLPPGPCTPHNDLP